MTRVDVCSAIVGWGGVSVIVGVTAPGPAAAVQPANQNMEITKISHFSILHPYPLGGEMRARFSRQRPQHIPRIGDQRLLSAALRFPAIELDTSELKLFMLLVTLLKVNVEFIPRIGHKFPD